MSGSRLLLSVVIVSSLVAACGDDVGSTPTSTTPEVTVPASTLPPTTTPPTTVPATTAPPTTAPPTTAPPTTSPPTTAPGVEGFVAVWPAADVVFSTPEAAAEDFIRTVFRVEPYLGEFRQGDNRSGEIEVLTPLDDDDPATTQPAGVVLFLRQLGDGWFVIGTGCDGVTIDQPAARAEVPAAPLDVTGLGRGFESTVVVKAIRVTDGTELDVQIVMTDWETPTPYATSVDLSDAEPGEVVVLVARGDTGIEATGEFAAIAVVIAG